MRVRPQVGQETMFTPSFRSPAALQDVPGGVDLLHRVAGQADTRMVSPMPSSSSAPMPMADLIMPLPDGAGLGHADVQGIVAFARGTAVRRLPWRARCEDFMETQMS